MGGVDVGDSGSRAKRSLNAELNLIPFIDLLFVTVAFLLITAVWVTNSRLNANALVPGPPDSATIETPPPERVLNLTVEPDQFTLAWKQGNDVLSEVKIPKTSDAGESTRYADLAKAIETEWRQNGTHKDASDARVDQAILHTDNRTPFKEIAAVMDALYATKRDYVVDKDGKLGRVPVFNLTFAVR
jgi:biopolymer transport protein ExbD